MDPYTYSWPVGVPDELDNLFAMQAAMDQHVATEEPQLPLFTMKSALNQHVATEESQPPAAGDHEATPDPQPARRPRRKGKRNGPSPDNYTSIVPGQENWCFENMPDIIYQFLGPSKVAAPADAKTKPSPYPGGPRLRIIPILPDRICDDIEEFRVEAWQRLDRTITLKDITDRMRPEDKLDENTLQQRGVRFRQLFNLVSWGQSSKETGGYVNKILDKMAAAGIDPAKNSTRGLTPGLVNPGVSTERIPLPGAYNSRKNSTECAPGYIPPVVLSPPNPTDATYATPGPATPFSREVNTYASERTPIPTAPISAAPTTPSVKPIAGLVTASIETTTTAAAVCSVGSGHVNSIPSYTGFPIPIPPNPYRQSSTFPDFTNPATNTQSSAYADFMSPNYVYGASKALSSTFHEIVSATPTFPPTEATTAFPVQASQPTFPLNQAADTTNNFIAAYPTLIQGIAAARKTTDRVTKNVKKAPTKATTSGSVNGNNRRSLGRSTPIPQTPPMRMAATSSANQTIPAVRSATQLGTFPTPWATSGSPQYPPNAMVASSTPHLQAAPVNSPIPAAARATRRMPAAVTGPSTPKLRAVPGNYPVPAAARTTQRVPTPMPASSTPQSQAVPRVSTAPRASTTPRATQRVPTPIPAPSTLQSQVVPRVSTTPRVSATPRATQRLPTVPASPVATYPAPCTSAQPSSSTTPAIAPGMRRGLAPAQWFANTAAAVILNDHIPHYFAPTIDMDGRVQVSRVISEEVAIRTLEETIAAVRNRRHRDPNFEERLRSMAVVTRPRAGSRPGETTRICKRPRETTNIPKILRPTPRRQRTLHHFFKPVGHYDRQGQPLTASAERLEDDIESFAQRPLTSVDENQKKEEASIDGSVNGNDPFRFLSYARTTHSPTPAADGSTNNTNSIRLEPEVENQDAEAEARSTESRNSETPPFPQIYDPAVLHLPATTFAELTAIFDHDENDNDENHNDKNNTDENNTDENNTDENNTDENHNDENNNDENNNDENNNDENNNNNSINNGNNTGSQIPIVIPDDPLPQDYTDAQVNAAVQASLELSSPPPNSTTEEQRFERQLFYALMCEL
ncbi:hypothetical protein FQN57_004113 [Myotisia sp. PD_48]|nr:hypothetical protein FQN57_004113 [Myotisia sp. PD_48]